jgi:hypothetical protein
MATGSKSKTSKPARSSRELGSSRLVTGREANLHAGKRLTLLLEKSTRSPCKRGVENAAQRAFVSKHSRRSKSWDLQKCKLIKGEMLPVL